MKKKNWHCRGSLGCVVGRGVDVFEENGIFVPSKHVFSFNFGGLMNSL